MTALQPSSDLINDIVNEINNTENATESHIGTLQQYGVEAQHIIDMALRAKEIGDRVVKEAVNTKSLSKYKDALGHYQQAVAAAVLAPALKETHRNFLSRCHCNISLCKFKLGDYLPALLASRESIKADRSNYSGHLRAAQALLAMDQIIGAGEVMRFLETKIPNDARYHQLHAEYKQQRTKLARETDYSRFDEISDEVEEPLEPVFEGNQLDDKKTEEIMKMLRGEPVNEQTETKFHPIYLHTGVTTKGDVPSALLKGLENLIYMRAMQWAAKVLGIYRPSALLLNNWRDSIAKMNQDVSIHVFSDPFDFRPLERVSLRHLLGDHTPMTRDHEGSAIAIIEPLKFSSMGAVLGDHPLLDSSNKVQFTVWPPLVRLYRHRVATAKRTLDEYHSRVVDRINKTDRTLCAEGRKYCSRDQLESEREEVAVYDYDACRLTVELESAPTEGSYAYSIELWDRNGMMIASDEPLNNTLHLGSLGSYHGTRIIEHNGASTLDYNPTRGFHFTSVSDEGSEKLSPIILPESLDNLIRDQEALGYIQQCFLRMVQETSGDQLKHLRFLCDTGVTSINLLILLPAAIEANRLCAQKLGNEPPKVILPGCFVGESEFLRELLPRRSSANHDLSIMALSSSLMQKLNSRTRVKSKWLSLGHSKIVDPMDCVEEGDIDGAKFALVSKIDLETQTGPTGLPNISAMLELKKQFNLYPGFGADAIVPNATTCFFSTMTECPGIVEHGLVRHTKLIHGIHQRHLRKHFGHQNLIDGPVRWVGAHDQLEEASPVPALPIYEIHAVGVKMKDYCPAGAKAFWGVYGEGMAFHQTIEFNDQSLFDVVTYPSLLLTTPLSDVHEFDLLECNLLPISTDTVVDAVLLYTTTLYPDECSNKGLKLTNIPKQLESSDIYQEGEVVPPENSTIEFATVFRTDQLLLRPTVVDNDVTRHRAWRWTRYPDSHLYEFILNLSSDAGCQLSGPISAMSTDKVLSHEVTQDDIQREAGFSHFSTEVLNRLMMSSEECQRSVDLLTSKESTFINGYARFKYEFAKQLIYMKQ